LTFTLAGIEVFSSIKGVRRDVGFSIRSLKALKFDKIRSKRRSRRSQATAFEAGRFEFEKRSDFLKGERGRQAVFCMEEVLIVGLVSFHLFPMYK
jgi:hypothetical protein